MTATFPHYHIQRFKSENRTNFTRVNNTQSLAGANLIEMETVDFLTALLFGWKSHMYCAKTTVFERLLMID